VPNLLELLFRELRLERLHQARSRLTGGIGDDVELDRRGHRPEASALPAGNLQVSRVLFKKA
jgi:hypothetical protein